MPVPKGPLGRCPGQRPTCWTLERRRSKVPPPRLDCGCALHSPQRELIEFLTMCCRSSSLRVSRRRRSALRGGRANRADRGRRVSTGLRAMRVRSTYARHRIRHGIRHTAARAGRRPRRSVPNGRLRHMLIGYARVCGRLMHQRPVLEVVRETQAHVPERAGVGQQLPRDGFAPIAAQIGNVTTQRIPDERVVTLEGRTVDPATLDTH